MGIQINGQTDTVSAIDGTINVGGIDLSASNSDIPGDLNVSGDLNVTGVITANSFTGDLIGNINSSGDGSTFNSNVGIQTNDMTRSDLVGAGNSFVGVYIGDGFLAFNPTLNNPNGYYITTSINALNAGPVTLGSTMTLDGTWVIV